MKNNTMNSDTTNTTRGGQIMLHQFRMFMQIQGWIFKWAIIAAIVIACVVCYLTVDEQTLELAFLYIKFNAMSFIVSNDHLVSFSFNGNSFKNTIGNLINSKNLHDAFVSAKLEFLYGLCITTIIIGFFTYLGVKALRSQGKSRTDDKYLRGTVLTTPQEVSKYLKNQKLLSDFAIDKIKVMKRDFEVQHQLIAGTTGTGKSQYLKRLISFIRKRGDKAIIYDKGCGFIGEFYDPSSDYILNPFDERSCDWDVWCDGQDETDFDNIAKALIPQSGESDPFWVEAARTIFASTAYKMKLDNDIERSTNKLLEIMLTSSLDYLSNYLKDTESSNLVSEKAAKLAISIKAILAAYVKCLRFLDGLSEPDSYGNKRKKLSIKDWVKSDDENGFLFLSSNAEQHTSLRPLISAWLSIASTSLLGLNPNPDRRIWVVMDEMPSLHKLPELAGTIAEVRKFGGCYAIGIQSFAQLQQSYGDKTAAVIYDLLNTRLFFRSPSDAMAKISAQDIGEVEYMENQEQYSYGAEQVRDGVSLGGKKIKEFAVSPTEITQLDDLSFYLKNAGRIPVCKMYMKYIENVDLHQGFINRTLPKTERGEKLDSLLAWSQLVPLSSSLDSSDKQKLVNEYENTYKEDTKNKKNNEMEKLSKEAEKFDHALTENIEPPVDASATEASLDDDMLRF